MVEIQTNKKEEEHPCQLYIPCQSSRRSFFPHGRQGTRDDEWAFQAILRMFNVEPINETYRRNCIIPNTKTGRNEAMERSNVVNFLSVWMSIKIVAPKDSMVVNTEKKRKEKPTTSFRGREMWNSCSSNGEVSKERNTTSEVKELAKETTSETVKIRK